ncbi:MAG: glycosyltransferase [Candidatus Hydrogenedentes bacterium]|nr:glycosyltransferase [Candidatus Hydrogenedentota bacterium]
MSETPSDRRYVLIVPTRDEEAFLQQSLDCFAGQTILPAECVIVDDGSSDRTGAIADEAAARYPWVHVVHRDDRGERKLGGGVIEAFYAGYDALETTDYTYICKIDGDVTFPEAYFENLIEKFEADPKLGGASGKTWNPVDGGLKEERLNDEMVAGQMNFWRRACWEQVGGYVREVMWDGIVFHRAHMFGWETHSFRDEPLRIIHHRLMGSSHRSVYHGRLRWGRGQWFMGTHPLYILASGVYRTRERPYAVGGLLIVAGFFGAMFRGAPRYDDLVFRAHLRRWQLGRLGLGFLASPGPKVSTP